METQRPKRFLASLGSGALTQTIILFSSGSFSFTFTPATLRTVQGTIVSQRDNAPVGSFDFNAPNSVHTVSLEANEPYLLQASTRTNLTAGMTVPAGLAAAIHADEVASP